MRLFFIHAACTVAAWPGRGRYRAAKQSPLNITAACSLSLPPRLPSPLPSPSSLPVVAGRKRWHLRSRCQPLRPASRPADGVLSSEMASTEPPAAWRTRHRRTFFYNWRFLKDRPKNCGHPCSILHTLSPFPDLNICTPRRLQAPPAPPLFGSKQPEVLLLDPFYYDSRALIIHYPSHWSGQEGRMR